MLVLGIDCAGHACAVCVVGDGVVLSVVEEKMERGQDARLVPMAVEVLKTVGKGFNEIDRFSATRGPGSFTGLRIGLATARGFGLAVNKPVIGVDRFEIYREQMKNLGKDFLVVLDSKRAELFCRFYSKSGDVCETALLTPEAIKEKLFSLPDTAVCGDAAEIIKNFIPETSSFVKISEPEVITCAKIAALVKSGDPDFLPCPLYLREPDVTFPKKLLQENRCA